tara:strand:+ start:136 stop:291 length:156 start_codon:yes stop_codon:yes gene_type:complete
MVALANCLAGQKLLTMQKNEANLGTKSKRPKRRNELALTWLACHDSLAITF